jgi:hypothetical protein
MIDQFAKNSILYSEAGVKLPSGMGEEKGEKTQIVDKEAYQASQKRRMDLRWAAREYMRANPDFKQGELREYINGLIEPDAKQQARDAAKGTREEAIPVQRPDFLRWYGLPEFIPGPPKAREPLSEEALIKREQEAAKQRTPVIGPTSQIVPQAPPPAAVTNVKVASNVLGGRLKGMESKFQAAADKYGIDPALLTAIAMHETGNGTSNAVNERNNPGGLMDPETNWSKIKQFASLDEGIDATAKNLKEKYIDQGLTTIEAIQTKYAPIGAANDPRKLNKDWVSGVNKYYNQVATRPTTLPYRRLERQALGVEPVPEAETLDARSIKNIATLKPEARGPMTSFVAQAKAWAKERGLDISVVEGYRSPERQAELYAQGRTKPGPIVTQAKPGQSRHQSARAIDVVITRDGKPVDEKRLWAQLGRIGQEMGLEWGGSWKSIYDPEHFQFNG